MSSIEEMITKQFANEIIKNLNLEEMGKTFVKSSTVKKIYSHLLDGTEELIISCINDVINSDEVYTAVYKQMEAKILELLNVPIEKTKRSKKS